MNIDNEQTRMIKIWSAAINKICAEDKALIQSGCNIKGQRNIERADLRRNNTGHKTTDMIFNGMNTVEN